MSDQASLLQEINNVEFFRGLNEQELSHSIKRARQVSIEKDKFLFHQGDPATVFYYVIKGRVKLTQVNEDGDQIILYYPGRGEVFGVIAVLREIDFPVSAESVEACQFLAWDQQTMKELMFSHPQLAHNAIRILSRYIIQFQNRIQELATQNVERRLAHTLLRLGQQTGISMERGIAIDLRLTRQDIAEMTGTTLFTVSRTLSKWENQGLLSTDNELILIKKPAQLTRIADDLAV